MDMQRAVDILRGGGLVAFPTETVYGLGADAASDRAVRRLLAVKRRPEGQAVSVLLPPEADFSQWCAWSGEARALAERFWPGPLTLVMPRRERVSLVVTGGMDTVGLRVPDHPVALELLRAFGGGLATPSANRTGSLSPTTAQHVRDDLGHDVDLVLDGGPCALGVESTVLLLHPQPRILRPGGVSRAQLEAVLAQPVAPATSAPALSLAAHVRLVSAGALEEELAREPEPCGVIAPTPPRGSHRCWLRAPTEPQAYAQRLYGMLRELEEQGCPTIYVVAPPQEEAWDAVRHRLQRASRTGPARPKE